MNEVRLFLKLPKVQGGATTDVGATICAKSMNNFISEILFSIY